MLTSFWTYLGLSFLLGPMLFFLILERIIPAEKGHDIRGIWNNLKIGIVYRISTFLYVGISANFAAWMMSHLPNKIFDLQFATGGYFILDLLAAFLWFFVFDFFYYWFHRMQHQISWLWIQHRVHHSVPQLNVTATVAHHWLEDALRVPVIVVPFGVLFNLNPFAAGAVIILANGWGYFIHSNLRLPLGHVSPIICGPQVHRIHHSIEPKHHDKNFAAFFPIWDVIFGTYYHPSKNEFPSTGVEGYPIPRTFCAIAFDPFVVWYKSIISNATERAASLANKGWRLF